MMIWWAIGAIIDVGLILFSMVCLAMVVFGNWIPDMQVVSICAFGAFAQTSHQLLKRSIEKIKQAQEPKG
jgi:hypothetical protein